MALTLRKAIDNTLTRMSLASGADVQVYSEEPLKLIIQQLFNTLFDSDEIWWPQFYTEGEEFTLGSNGEVTANLSTKIKRFQDIRYIWYGSWPNPLPRVHGRYNPSLSGNYSYGPSNTTGKVFRLYPSTVSGTVTVGYRTKPDDFDVDTDIIDMDDDLIIYGAAYDYLNSLGLNAVAEEKFLNRFQDRYNTLKDQITHREVYLPQSDYNPDWTFEC